MKKFFLFFVLTGMFYLSACGSKDSNPSGPSVSDPRLSVINGSIIANTDTRLAIDSDTVNYNFVSGSVLPYRTLSIGNHRVTIKYKTLQSTGSSTLGLDYNGDQRYTMFVYDNLIPGIGSTVNLTRVQDNRSNPSGGNCKLRVAYFSTDAGTLRVEISGSSNTFSGLSNGTVSDFREFAGSSATANVIQVATGETLASTSLNLQNGSFYTLMISGKLRASSPRIDVKLINQD